MLWAHGIEATLENLGSRPGLVEGPMVLAARGKIARKGTVWFAVTADPLAERLTFAGSAGAQDFDPSQLNAYLSPKKDVTLTPGSYSMKMSFRCDAGKLTGTTEGTRPSGAIAIRDDLTDPKLQLAPRLEKVIENGFVLGLQEALKRQYSGKLEASSKPEPTPLKAKK